MTDKAETSIKKTSAPEMPTGRYRLKKLKSGEIVLQELYEIVKFATLVSTFEWRDVETVNE